jgi:hypothetical protein
MLFNVFTSLPMINSATNTISFNGYDRIFFSIKRTSFTGTGANLKFFATNDNIDVLIKEFDNDDLALADTIGLSFRGCPNEIKAIYTAGSNTGTLDIIANII